MTSAHESQMKPTGVALQLRLGDEIIDVHVGPDRRSERREVYFIRAVGLSVIKIGVANSAVRRFKALGEISPCKLELIGAIECDKAGALERELHQRFAHLRSHGEWFFAEPELAAYIHEHAREPRPPKRPGLRERHVTRIRRRELRRRAALSL